MRDLKVIDWDIQKLKDERDLVVAAIKEKQLAELRKRVPDVEWSELNVDGYVMTHLPFKFDYNCEPATVTSIRRDSDGDIQFQIGQANGTPLSNGDVWLSAYELDSDDI